MKRMKRLEDVYPSGVPRVHQAFTTRQATKDRQTPVGWSIGWIPAADHGSCESGNKILQPSHLKLAN